MSPDSTLFLPAKTDNEYPHLTTGPSQRFLQSIRLFPARVRMELVLVALVSIWSAVVQVLSDTVFLNRRALFQDNDMRRGSSSGGSL